MMVAPEIVAPGRKDCARKACRNRHPPHRTASMASPLSAFHTSGNSALKRRVSSSLASAGTFTTSSNPSHDTNVTSGSASTQAWRAADRQVTVQAGKDEASSRRPLDERPLKDWLTPQTHDK